MDEKSIIKLYGTAVDETGFIEDKDNIGWMPKLGPNDYRSIIRHGTYKNIPAVLEVSPYEDLGKIVDDFKKYQEGSKNKKAVRISKILTQGKIKDGQYLIRASADSEQMQGVHIVKNWPLATETEMKEVAKLYWETATSFPPIEVKEWSISDYFIRRLNIALTKAREYYIDPLKYMSHNEKDDLVEFIFTHAKILTVEDFFDHFSNTDLVKQDNEYYSWGSIIVPKPETAGIAYWLWGAMMYTSKLTPEQWVTEYNKWVAVFINSAPESRKKDLELKIKLNMAERVISTLLIDFPLKRSPLDKQSDEEIERTRLVFRRMLKEILSKK